MPTIKELHDLHLSHLDTILSESELLLQREGGLDGELRTSGAICERFVTQTLAKFIVPGQFRVATGFVATPEFLRAKKNLPQCDILLVDRNAVPLLRFEDSGLEVVPREAVKGIIEVKRSLTKESLTGKSGALSHIDSIVEALCDWPEVKTDNLLRSFNPAAGKHNHSSNKPLLGVIALQSQMTDFNEVPRLITEANSLVDFVWTLDGNAAVPAFRDGGSTWYYTHPARPMTRTWANLRPEAFLNATSEFYKTFKGEPFWAVTKAATRSDRAAAFALVIAVVSLMLSRICPRPLAEDEVNDYYLR